MAKMKLKTLSGAKKRFKMTASGKIKRNASKRRHILTKKTTKLTRGLRTVWLQFILLNRSNFFLFCNLSLMFNNLIALIIVLIKLIKC